MDGQTSIFDLEAGKGERRPYEYGWQRYIGQRVILLNGKVGTITRIEPYYTEVDTGDCICIGTATTMAPYKGKEQEDGAGI